jgi:hypothetical protein
MYFSIKDVYGYKKSMYELRNTINEEASKFSDTSILGVFIDNHDNERFLHA